MRLIPTFEQFKRGYYQPSYNVNEADGFGTSAFLLKKVSDVYHYFFNIEKESGGESMGYHLLIGKFSDSQVIEGPKNSYCVMTLNQISHELIEDIAVDKEEIPEVSKEKFAAGGNEVSRIMEFVSKCLINYMESNPKVNRIYDEIQENLEFKGDGTYMEFMKSIVLSYLGTNWYVQEGSNSDTILISR